jgi:hypothetical protein
MELWNWVVLMKRLHGPFNKLQKSNGITLITFSRITSMPILSMITPVTGSI